MKKTIILGLLVFPLVFGNSVNAQENDFKLFEKSTDFTGFGGLTVQMLNGDYFLFGVQGAARYGNYYFGGFGFSGNLGNYIYPLSGDERSLQRNTGGLMLGGVSNTKQLFALYGDFKLNFDQYNAKPTAQNASAAELSYRTISLLPAAGIVFRPIYFIEIRVGAGYNQSGLVEDGGLENVPYRAPMFNFDINFGGF